MSELTELPLSETQLAEKRMASVERQIHAKMPKGIIKRILCPYCGTWNVHEKGKLLCCDTLRQAVIAVLVADRALAAAEAGEKAIAELMANLQLVLRLENIDRRLRSEIGVCLLELPETPGMMVFSVYAPNGGLANYGVSYVGRLEANPYDREQWREIRIIST